MARTGKESKLERENSCRRDTRILRSLIIKTEKKKQKKKKTKKSTSFVEEAGGRKDNEFPLVL